MNKMVERLMNNLIIRRNWITILNCTTSQCCLHFSQDVKQLADNYESNKKGLDSANINNNVRNFIKNIENNYKTMNIHEVIITMNTLYKSFNNNKEFDVRNLKEIEEFEYMCDTILRNARTLNTHNTIRILHMLLFFNVSPNSVLIQTLLQLISVSINELTVGQIMTLHAMLKNKQDTPLVKALLKALPFAFTQQARMELDLESTNLMRALRFCSIIKDVQTRRYIIKLLAKTDQCINLNYIVDIFYVIYNLPELCVSSKNLLTKINKIIENDAQSLKFKEIETLLYYISMKFVKSEMDFFNQKVVNTLCTAVLNNESTFNEIILIVKHLNKMRYCNIDLLNILLKKCLEDKNIFTKCIDVEIDHLIKALVIANYKLDNWEIVKKMLLNRVIDMECSLHNMASVAICLLSIDCYCPEFLNKLFTLYNSCNYVKKNQTTLIMLKLHWYLKLLYPQYVGAMLDESKFNHIEVELENNNMPYLKESLEEAVGGSKYVKSNLITKIGEFVDHAIVMPQDDSFVNIENCDITFAEELDLYSECSKILFFGYPKEAYCTNTKNLLPTVQMSLETIEKLTGSYFCVINPFSWENFTSKQRIEHLMKCIKLKHTDSSNT